MKRTSRKGFTLIELIVTIVILGILAALAVPAFQAVIERARQNATAQAANSIAREAHAFAAFDDAASVAGVVFAATDTDGDLVRDELDADFTAAVDGILALDDAGVAATVQNNGDTTNDAGEADQLLVEEGDYEVIVNLDVAAGTHTPVTVDNVTANATAGAVG